MKILSHFIKYPEGRVKSSIVYKAISFNFKVYSTLKRLIYGPAYKNEEGRLSFKGNVNGTLIFLEPSRIDSRVIGIDCFWSVNKIKSSFLLLPATKSL